MNDSKENESVDLVFDNNSANEFKFVNYWCFLAW